MKKFLLFLSLFLLTVTSNAQKSPGIVKGILQDSTGQALDDATVSVITASDSSLVSFSLTSNSGYFEIKNVETGDYILVVSYTGFETLKKPFSVSAEKPVADLQVVKMEKSYDLLSEVVVKDEAPIRIKGDTIAYNADAFKTKPNATVEDLLKKLPGVSVEKDGTVKAQGENVQKVYVDGKEFFNNDPKLATKNLTADMVDQVEVFDDMSEQAKFNKIDDGSRTKAINLKLKKDKKKGVFGKAYAGYGTEDRYDAGLTANMFKGATQVSVIAKANNTNNIGFTISDAMGMFGAGGFGGMSAMMGGGGMSITRGMSLPMGGGFSMSGGNSGITRTGSAGINYRDTWSKYFDVNGSYFYNNAKSTNARNSFRQTFFPDSTITRDQQGYSVNENANHRFNFNLIYSVDSFNSIIFQPSISFQNSSTFRDDTTTQHSIRNGVSTILNNIHNVNENTGEGINMSNNLIWRHKTRKAGRTFSLSLNNNFNNSERVGYTLADESFFKGGSEIARNTRRQSLQDNSTNNYSVNASYTEPLARNKILEVNYGYNRNFNESDRNTLDYNTATGKYDNLNDTLSNHFENYNNSNRVGANYRFIEKKYNYQLGIAVQNTLLRSNNLSKGNDISQRYTNIFPTASYQYQFARSRSLRVNYRGRTNQPSISQLQDVLEESSKPFYRIGNPDLKQEFSNNISVSYNFFDMVKFRNMFALINFSNTMDKIVENVTRRNFPAAYQYLAENPGNQLTTYTNLDGVYNITGVFNIGFPIKKMKGGNFNTNTRVSYGKNGNLIEGMVNFTKNLTIGEDLRLSYNYKQKLDLGVSGSVNYTSAKYTLSSPLNPNTSYFTHIYSADFTYTFPKNFILSSDIDYTLNPKQDNSPDRDFTMWNASFGKQFGKNKRTELKASVYDILSQNRSFNRYVGDGYVEDVTNTTLKRFFLLSLTYNLNRMGGKSMLPPAIERATRNVRIN